jgi:hypothetical protein
VLCADPSISNVTILRNSYLKLDSCGGYPKNYSTHTVAEQYREYAAMRDALNATGRPIYYSICEINQVIPSVAVADSPSACGRTHAYTSLPWLQNQSPKYDVRRLANSILIEWVNNMNGFCERRDQPPPPSTSALKLAPCSGASPAAQWVAKTDGSLRTHGGLCMDVNNCGKADGTAVAVYRCHPNGTAECGYKNQQWTFDKKPTGAIRNVNSGTCLTWGGSGLTISRCQAGRGAVQSFSLTADGLLHYGGVDSKSCLVQAGGAPTDPGRTCCSRGWVSQIDSQQDLTVDELSGPGYWNDNDVRTCPCMMQCALPL